MKLTSNILLVSCKQHNEGIWIFFKVCPLKWFIIIYLAAPGITCGFRTLSCGMWDLVPCPGIKSGPPALGEWSVSLWTTWEIPKESGFLMTSMGQWINQPWNLPYPGLLVMSGNNDIYCQDFFSGAKIHKYISWIILISLFFAYMSVLIYFA